MNGHLLLTIAASIVPTQRAVIDDEREWTYEELLRQSTYVAYALQDVHVGETVAILLTNRVEYVATLLACWQLGIVAMPVNPRLKDTELSVVLSGVHVLVSEKRYEQQLHAQHVMYIEQMQELAYDVQHEHTQALTLLTSGSTRTPKKVEIFHEQFAEYIFAHNEAPDGSERGVYLQTVPLFHITGLTSLWNALYSGRTVVLQEGFDAKRWLQAVRTYAVTHSFVVPTMLHDIVEQPQEALHSLQYITYGGAPMPRAIIERAIETLPHVSFSNAYGLTETTATITVLSPEDHRLDDEQKLVRLQSVGKPVADVSIRICKDGRVCAPYERGVIEVKTQRLNAYSGQSLEEWFVTHDEGYLDEDGYLFLTGRSSDVIVRGGENIAAQEVEDALCKLPYIAQAAVVGVEDAKWGEVVCAMVVATKHVEDVSIQNALKKVLASFKVPARFMFVQTLPLQATGKIDKQSIKGIFRAQKGKSMPYGE